MSELALYKFKAVTGNSSLLNEETATESNEILQGQVNQRHRRYISLRIHHTALYVPLLNHICSTPLVDESRYQVV